MALLNVSMSSKLPTKLPHLHPHPPHHNHFSLPSYPAPHLATLRTPRSPHPLLEISRTSLFSSVLQSVSNSSLLALLSASLLVVDPALAFKGGGPYGSEVTRGQDLTGKDFSGKTLIKQDFKTSILRQAKFKGANLLGASFFDADLTGADLSDADLRGADFSLANVAKVNLSNANLEGALATGNTSFKGSIITDFTDVPLRDDQREYLCKIADGVNSKTGNATRDTLLCN
ncbi:thylakoid lumenal 15 kDa protein 1, chloroplastic isoform X2 [Cannabis sativa]|uniref:thylakoid lumenal 15 kDa protein 1, chloroplastic isoform X2 n=1 Tax=Cannabis sativa TaxID=3483 RepID=UPI0029C9BCA8|nr:thylakoid lumenal 15 kDa protein 1, chloroplastic isoform X2 [Cannabis sativa]